MYVCVCVLWCIIAAVVIGNEQPNNVHQKIFKGREKSTRSQAKCGERTFHKNLKKKVTDMTDRLTDRQTS